MRPLLLFFLLLTCLRVAAQQPTLNGLLSLLPCSTDSTCIAQGLAAMGFHPNAGYGGIIYINQEASAAWATFNERGHLNMDLHDPELTRTFIDRLIAEGWRKDLQDPKLEIYRDQLSSHLLLVEGTILRFSYVQRPQDH